ncbi:MAG: hypothetical protein KBE65_08210 [Phycisphaerae bacterium]|nr:hypothetical protein [Phycisphaerae bacterium]
MTHSHKTSIRLTLLMVVALAAGRGSAQSNMIAASGTSTVPGAGRSTGIAFLSTGRGWIAEPAMVIPAKEMDAQTAAQFLEDLSIMGRIIERSVANVIESADSDLLGFYRRMHVDNRDSSPCALFSSIGRARPLYVAGYGALFFVRVDFPLLPPPQTTEKAPAKDESDVVWAETRRSILEPETSRAPGPRDDETAVPYDRARVDALKSALTTTMKHGKNIRGLDADEWLTIVVQGTSGRTDASATTTVGNGSTLTLRVKKSDAELYAKGELIQTQFEQRLQVVSY